MDPNVVTRQEFELFKDNCDIEHLRLAEEDKRQNERLKVIEGYGEQIKGLAISINELAGAVKGSAKETERLSGMIKENVEKLDSRLTKLENRDGDKWRSVTAYMITAIVSLILGYLFTLLTGA